MDNALVTVITVGLTAIIGQFFNAHRDKKMREWANADRLAIANEARERATAEKMLATIEAGKQSVLLWQVKAAAERSSMAAERSNKLTHTALTHTAGTTKKLQVLTDQLAGFMPLPPAAACQYPTRKEQEQQP